jgi:sugar-specific transcriptional regulator TrmB
MHTKLYELLGLSPNEGKLYETLIEMGQSTVSIIATKAGIHRRNAYDAIERLIDKGLCFKTFSGTEQLYSAVHPDKLREILGETQQQLEVVLPVLKKKFNTHAIHEEAYIYRGLEGQKNIWKYVIEAGKDSYFIGAKGGWFDARLETARTMFLKEADKKKIKFIQIFDDEVRLSIKDIEKEFGKKLTYRFLPKEYSTDSAVHIFGDYVVTYTGISLHKLDSKLVFFVLKSKHLADSYRTWFTYMWKLSSK